MPPYSSDLSLIEKAWAKLKQFIRSAKAHLIEAPHQAVADNLPAIQPDMPTLGSDFASLL